MSELHKISVKIGGAEFSAEGDQKAIHDQYQLFLTALKYAPPKADIAQENAHGGNPPRHGGPVGSDGTQNLPTIRELPKPTMDRMFKVDAQDVVSLHALPSEGNVSADALVMLLYGYLKLTHTSSVTALMLMRGAQQSGLGIDRIDRIISANSAYITKAGAKRGTKYGLNNRGEQYAVQLIQKVLG